MFAKLKYHKWFVTVLSVLLVLISSYFAYDRYQYDAFKRAYEHGTVYEQLDTLMNSTRYVKEVRKAGYHIDDYNLKMTNRISSLKTKGQRPVEIISPDASITMITVRNINGTPDVIATFVINKQLELEYAGYMTQGISPSRRIEVDKELTNQITNEVKAEVKAMIKDIYQSIYGN